MTRVALVMAALFAVTATGCKGRDPDWCESNNECDAKRNGKTMCDIKGRFGTANTCIRPDTGADASDTAPLDVPRLDLRIEVTRPDADDAALDSTAGDAAGYGGGS